MASAALCVPRRLYYAATSPAKARLTVRAIQPGACVFHTFCHWDELLALRAEHIVIFLLRLGDRFIIGARRLGEVNARHLSPARLGLRKSAALRRLSISRGLCQNIFFDFLNISFYNTDCFVNIST